MGEIIRQTIGDKKQNNDLNQALQKKLLNGDKLIISKFSVLGLTSIIVADLLIKLLKIGVIVHSAYDGIIIGGAKGDLKTELKLLSVFRSIEDSLIKDRIKRGMIKKKKSGLKLGRPVGRKSTKLRLTGKEETIKDLLGKKISLTAIGKLTGANRVTVKNFIILNHLDENI